MDLQHDITNAQTGSAKEFIHLNAYPADKYNVLVPVTLMEATSKSQRILVNQVQLDTTVDSDNVGRDIYKLNKDHKDKRYAITKVGIMKLAAAANISVVSTKDEQPTVCKRCLEVMKAINKAKSCGTCPHVHDVRSVVEIQVPEPGGGFRYITKEKELDFTIEKKSKGDKGEARVNKIMEHRVSIASTGAFLRCIRDALGVASSYTLEDLKKPFVVARLAPNLDAPENRDLLKGYYSQTLGLTAGQHTLAEPQGKNPPTLESPARSIPAPDPGVPLQNPSSDPLHNPGFSDSAGSHQNHPSALDSPYQNSVNSMASASPLLTHNTMASNMPEDDFDDFDDLLGDEEGELPWDQDQGEIFCEGCGSEITEVKKNKKLWTPELLRDFSLKRFGKCLCVACQKAASQKAASKGG